MSSYLVGDMVSAIKNGYMANLSTVEIPYSNFKESIARVLEREGYLSAVKIAEKEGKKNLVFILKYEARKPQITEIKLISKPGLRRYTKAKEVKKVLGGLGTLILSTPKGVLSGKMAKKQGLGGEIICEVW